MQSNLEQLNKESQRTNDSNHSIDDRNSNDRCVQLGTMNDMKCTTKMNMINNFNSSSKMEESNSGDNNTKSRTVANFAGDYLNSNDMTQSISAQRSPKIILHRKSEAGDKNSAKSLPQTMCLNIWASLRFFIPNDSNKSKYYQIQVQL